MKTLKPVHEALETIANEPSTLKKLELIKGFIADQSIAPMLRKVVSYTLNPFMRFNMKEFPKFKDDEEYEEYLTENPPDVEKMFAYLNFMSTKQGATHDEQKKLYALGAVDPATTRVLKRIVTKDLRCGASKKYWRKYVPDIPEHNVMLCIDNLTKFKNEIEEDWNKACYSIKLDGVRCWAVVTKEGAVKFLSRNGKEFPNFSKFNGILLHVAEILNEEYKMPYPIILDGEVVSKDAKFQNMMTQIRRHKDADTSIFEFHIFDIVVANKTLRQRDQIIKEIVPQYRNKDIVHVEHLPLPSGVNSIEKIVAFTNGLCAKGYEGIVVKTWDGHYEMKRSNIWCKVKQMHTVDLPVTGVAEGTGRNKGRMGKLLCDYNGVEVGVGSGYNDEEREEFYTKPPKMIEVKYQELTRDKNLRFPVYIRTREDK